MGTIICGALAGEGMRVVVGYNRSAEKAKALAASLPGEGHAALAAPVTDSTALAALAASSGARVAANSAPGKPAAPAKVAGGRPRTLASQAESLKAGKTRTPAGKAAAARKPAAPAAKQETAQAKMPSETKASTRDPAPAMRPRLRRKTQ